MKKERENELLIKGAMLKVTEILKDFNNVMNATLGDTVKETSSEGTIERKATLQDTIEFYKNEWYNITDRLYSEAGIDLEDDKSNIQIIKENHKRVCEQLKIFSQVAETSGSISYLEYKDNIQIPYNNVEYKEDINGGTMLMIYYGDSIENSSTVFILLDKNKRYKVIDKTNEGMQPMLVEI